MQNLKVTRLLFLSKRALIVSASNVIFPEEVPMINRDEDEIDKQLNAPPTSREMFTYAALGFALWILIIVGGSYWWFNREYESCVHKNSITDAFQLNRPHAVCTPPNEALLKYFRVQ